MSCIIIQIPLQRTALADMNSFSDDYVFVWVSLSIYRDLSMMNDPVKMTPVQTFYHPSGVKSCKMPCV